MMSSNLRIGNLFGGAPERGFYDIPLAEPGALDTTDMVVLGVPTATPYKSVGAYCADAPSAIRNAVGWPGMGEHFDFDLGGVLLRSTHAIDWGDVTVSDDDFAHNRQLITSTVRQVLDGGAVPVVLGGDDSVPIPCLQAFDEHGPITVLQLDAHIDWRDEVQGERFGLSSNMRRASEMAWVDNIIQVGARGSGSARPTDVSDARDWGVHFFPMTQVRSDGFDAIISAVPEGARLYIAFDIDVMDPSVVPGVIGPAPGGFHYGEVADLLSAVAAKTTIVGFNLAEYAPAADVGNRGALVASRLTATIMGLIDRQRG